MIVFWTLLILELSDTFYPVISGSFSMELQLKGRLGNPVNIGLGFDLVLSSNKS